MCCNVYNKTSEKYVWIQQHSKISNSFLAPKELPPLKALEGIYSLQWTGTHRILNI